MQSILNNVNKSLLLLKMYYFLPIISVSIIFANCFSGFVFDGYDEYRNLSESDPESSQIAMYQDPTFVTFEEISFNPKADDYIEFQVK